MPQNMARRVGTIGLNYYIHLATLVIVPIAVYVHTLSSSRLTYSLPLVGFSPCNLLYSPPYLARSPFFWEEEERRSM